ncbi:hypothetical protein Ait01nite_047630 [Actinoplanes italicus]|uniref:F5/8 type C domain-containing protein n=1 Tax=Actinoplanes italicus TaxID=113567 RepID=A0A2T0KA76_9ACTN|nr:discoidin domain-containing protein [Actinoplanes italicus]PRX19866.1 F5/8 type C domain-containing protein [Actinoplanes italicus]GIE31718.1 hypothetical protein Ait01nite_047630 [Actinoplanes italicus]
MERRDGGLPVDPVSGEQRRPSRADSLRLTRMPQIPRTPPPSPSGSGSAEAQGLSFSAPDAVRPERSRRRRWPWVAAGATLALAVPLSLLAAQRTGGRNPAEAAAPAPTVPTEQVASTPDPASAAPTKPPNGSAARPSAPAPSPSVSGRSSSVSGPPKPAATGRANPSGVNLALQGTATASASEGDPWRPANACDGDASTRWSSGFSDPQWIRVDLGRAWQISEVVLVWEHAYGAAYRVETSLDGKTWKRAYSTTTGAGGTVRIAAKTNARHVRMYGTKRSGIYGYSLIEFEIR